MFFSEALHISTNIPDRYGDTGAIAFLIAVSVSPRHTVISADSLSATLPQSFLVQAALRKAFSKDIPDRR